MNRTVAQAAKVLGVTTELVKRWAVVFAEHLSSGANPAKGTARAFNDSDLLALLFVGSRWEEEPDLEAIRIGLSSGYQHEEEFVERIYLSTPLLQDPPDDLDETWRHGVLLSGGVRHGYFELARNYRHIAESMLETALEADDVYDSAYPVLYAYRHTLELYLKLLGEVKEQTHSLARCVHLLEKHFNRKVRSPIREWILELESIDPGGTTFRYADESSGLPPCAEHWFDFLHFRFAMRRVFDELDSAALRYEKVGCF